MIPIKTQTDETALPVSGYTGPVPERLAHNARETRALCGGVSRITLWRWTQRGLLCPVPGIRHKLYARSEIERFLTGTPAN